jgi:putative ABC transport system permease protein
LSWLPFIFRRRSIYRDLGEELRQHLEEKTEQLMRDEGLSRRDAELAARRAFGNVTLVEERSRSIWQWPTLESIGADIKYALRQLHKSPGFACTVIATLALGIGANTAVFSVMNAVLLRPLSFPQPERIFQIEKIAGTSESYTASTPLFLEWRNHNRVFDHIAAYSVLPVGFNLAERERPERVSGLRVSADFFRVLGVAPAEGRSFSGDEDRIGSQRVVILGDSLWHRRYNGDPGLIGRSIKLDGEAYTVIGILPRGFQFLATMPTSSAIEVWAPLQLPSASRDPSSTLECIARLKSGVTREQAGLEMTSLTRRLARELPAVFPLDGRLNLLPLQQRITGDTRPTLLLLLGAVAFILLIACANVANLLLARMGSRAREIAVRSALGAGRLRIIRQILTESLLLAALGGGLGLLLAWLSDRVLVAIAPAAIVRAGEVHLDWRVLLFAAAVSLLTGIVFGSLPALRMPGIGAAASLHGGSFSGSSRRATAGRSHQRLSGALVIAETALSLMLLIAAGLLMESFLKLREVNPGFNYNQLLTFETTLPAARYGTPADLQRFLHAVTERIEAIPGVESAASASSLPAEPILEFPFTIEGAPGLQPGQATGDSDYVIVSPDYFRAMRIPILEGRAPAETDAADAPGVVVINQAMARKYWPNQDPIGKRMVIAKNLGPDWVDRPREVIGVAGDARADSLEEPPAPAMYTPFAQLSPHFVSILLGTIPVRWVARGRAEPSGLVNEIGNAVLSVDSEEPIAEVRSMRELLSGSLLRWRFNMLLLGAFAGIALLLAAIGLYGVIAYTVTQRTREIGIRMALGAGRGSVLRMVLRQAVILLAAGTLTGFSGVAMLSRVLKGFIYKGFIYGVTPGNAGVLIGVAVLMFTVGVMAAWKPARRAASIDPMQALRAE